MADVADGGVASDAAVTEERIYSLALEQSEAELHSTTTAAQDAERNATALLGFDGVIATILLRSLPADAHQQVAVLIATAGAGLSGLLCVLAVMLQRDLGSRPLGGAIVLRTWENLIDAQGTIIEQVDMAARRNRRLVSQKRLLFLIATSALFVAGAAAASVYVILSR